MTQLFTGHGCFGTYLKRIGKADVATCPFCNLEDDSADHIIWRCPEWRNEPTDLIGVIGPDLSLAGIVRNICDNREGWILAFSKFAKAVMKEGRCRTF